MFPPLSSHIISLVILKKFSFFVNRHPHVSHSRCGYLPLGQLSSHTLSASMFLPLSSNIISLIILKKFSFFLFCFGFFFCCEQTSPRLPFSQWMSSTRLMERPHFEWIHIPSTVIKHHLTCHFFVCKYTFFLSELGVTKIDCAVHFDVSFINLGTRSKVTRGQRKPKIDSLIFSQTDHNEEWDATGIFLNVLFYVSVIQGR